MKDKTQFLNKIRNLSIIETTYKIFCKHNYVIASTG